MRIRQIARWVVLLALLGLGAVAASEPTDPRARFTLTGACYCRATGALRCLGELTERQCGTRCAEELCDDWYWLERRPCWNWGYGG